jgi:hypothetical protein
VFELVLQFYREVLSPEQRASLLYDRQKFSSVKAVVDIIGDP